MTLTLVPMTIAVDTAPPSTSGRSTISAIARTEGVRAIRHPMTWIGVLASLWLMWDWMATDAPILPRDSIRLAGALLPLAATSLLVARDASIRERDTAELLDATPSGRNRRTLGIQVGMLWLVGLAAVLQVIGFAYLLLGDPVGHINWWELLAGPLAVLVAALGGVVIGRRLPNPIFAPLLLLVMAYLQMIAAPDLSVFSPTETPIHNFEWMALWMPPGSFEAPESLFARPYVERFWYLVGLAVVLAIWALTMHGTGRIVRAGTTVLVAAGITFGVYAIPSDLGGLRFNWIEAADNMACEVIDGVEYCALPMYQGWITHWADTVASVDDLVPLELDHVIQRPPNWYWPGNLGLPDTGTAVVAGIDWDRRGQPPERRIELAHRVGLAAVGLPTFARERLRTEAEIESFVQHYLGSFPDADPDELRESLRNDLIQGDGCTAAGQARAAVVAWIALAAGDPTESNLPKDPFQYMIQSSSGVGGTEFGNPVTIPRSDLNLGRAMFDLPTEEVASQLRLRWSEVVDPSTTTADLAAWFGLTAPDYTGEPTSQEQCQ